MAGDNSEEYRRRLRSFLLENFSLEPDDLEVFISAFTHSSHKTPNDRTDYEKLEHLGDSCVQLVVTSYLYSLNISLKEMSNLRKEIVQSSSLSYVSEKIGLREFLRVGKSCKEITKSMLEDIYESFMGAVYISSGFNKMSEIVNSTLLESFNNKELIFAHDYKSQLQEFVQKRIKKEILYTLENTIQLEEGKQMFFVTLTIGGEVKGRGEANRLKDAEQMAAKVAYNLLTQ